jgi:hypothetical protein
LRRRPCRGTGSCVSQTPSRSPTTVVRQALSSGGALLTSARRARCEGQPWLLRHPRRVGAAGAAAAPGGTACPVRNGMRSRLRGQVLPLLASLIPSQLSCRWPWPLDAIHTGIKGGRGVDGISFADRDTVHPRCLGAVRSVTCG